MSRESLEAKLDRAFTYLDNITKAVENINEEIESFALLLQDAKNLASGATEDFLGGSTFIGSLPEESTNPPVSLEPCACDPAKGIRCGYWPDCGTDTEGGPGRSVAAPSREKPGHDRQDRERGAADGVGIGSSDDAYEWVGGERPGRLEKRRAVHNEKEDA